jgi:hypothetical protein
MQWDEDGGNNADITYEIISDLPCDSKKTELDNSDNSDPLRRKDAPQVLALSQGGRGTISGTVTDP